MSIVPSFTRSDSIFVVKRCPSKGGLAKSSGQNLYQFRKVIGEVLVKSHTVVESCQGYFVPSGL